MLVPKGYEQLDLTDGAVHTLTIPAGSYFALIQGEGQILRWRDDGTSPTTAIGMRLLVGELVFYHGYLSAFKVIGEAAGGAKLNVSYYS